MDKSQDAIAGMVLKDEDIEGKSWLHTTAKETLKQ